MAKNYITNDGFKRLQAEYHQLVTVERPKLVEVIGWAASNGDRSENADYIYGKRRLREIDKRIKFLKDRLESAVVVDPLKIETEKVVFGAKVELEDEEGEVTTYRIVGEDESEPEKGRISWQSPVANALIGKVEGDEIIVKRPAGEKVFVILSISK